MHAALFAMIVHAHDTLIEKIDADYVAKLHAILDDLARARSNSRRLLGERNRPDQKRVLEANVKAQNLSKKAALFYQLTMGSASVVFASQKHESPKLSCPSNPISCYSNPRFLSAPSSTGLPSIPLSFMALIHASLSGRV